MKIRVVTTVVHEVEVPEGATHYAGDLLDDPTWWKYSENSTGTFKGWCCYDPNRGDWMIGQQTIEAPRWVKPIGAIPTVMESPCATQADT